MCHYFERQLTIAGDCALLLLDKSGTPLSLLTTEQWKDPQKEHWEPFFIAGGRELLLFDNKTPIFHRYNCRSLR